VNYIRDGYGLLIGVVLFVLVKRPVFKVLLIVSLLINILYAFSDLQMNYGHRFAFQSMAAFFLAALSLLEVANSIAGAIAIIYFSLGVTWGIWASHSLRSTLQSYPEIRAAHGELGVALGKFKNENLKLMIGDAGMVPYYSQWSTFDYIGLANKRVAKYGMNINLAREFDPDLIIIYSSVPGGEFSGFEYVINQAPVQKYIEESGNYSYVGSIKMNDKHYLVAFLKNGIPAFSELSATISAVQDHSNIFKFNLTKMIKLEYLKPPGDINQ
jgi:hypothetical protein